MDTLRHRHAGGQTTEHTPLSAFILASEQMLGNALVEARVQHGLDHEITNALRDAAAEMYLLRLKVLGY